MSDIGASIELHYNFINNINQVINVVNMGIIAVEDFGHTLNQQMDTAPIDAVRDSFDQAAIAAQELDTAVQSVEMPAVESSASPTPEWRSDNLEIFTGNGLDRFQQEIQSACSMLDTLNQAQNRIVETAGQTKMFPEGMLADMNGMQARLQAIQQQIQQMENHPLKMESDTANAKLEQLRSQLAQAVQEQESLNQAIENMDVQAANEAYLRLSSTVGGTQRYIRDNVNEQRQFNDEIQKGTEHLNALMQTMVKAAASQINFRNMAKAFDLSDELSQTAARLNRMNDGLQSAHNLMDMVYLSAQNARSSFSDMANLVIRFGNHANNAFGSTAEMVAFAELVQKQMTIAGASTTEASGAMQQLAQGLGTGVLRGDEFNALLKQAPNLVQNIADYLQVPISEIRNMASEGELTADIVKNAIFAASDEINANFAAMPMTWDQIWQSFQNTALIAFRPVLERLNELANSQAFQEFISNAAESLSAVAGIALGIVEVLAGIAGLVSDNWSILAPIIGGVTAALIGYYTALAVYNGIQAVGNGLKAAASICAQLHAITLSTESGATFAATAAQQGFNAALLASPITWIILAIITFIAVLYATIAVVNKLTGSTYSAAGIICGIITTALAFIGNGLITVWNIAVEIVADLFNVFIGFANFLGNLFNDPVAAVIGLVVDMGDAILGIVEGALEALSWISFGLLDFTDDIARIRGNINSWFEENYGDRYTEYVEEINPDLLKANQIDYGDAWDAGYNWGAQLEDSLSDMFSLDSGSEDIYNYLNEMAEDLGTTADNTESIAGSMEVTEEELKYLRDIAEQEAVNRFTTAEIVIEQTNHNHVSGRMDLDGVVSGLTDAVNEAVDMITEGVHD